MSNETRIIEMSVEKGIWERAKGLLAIENLYKLTKDEEALNPEFSDEILVGEVPIELDCGICVSIKLFLFSIGESNVVNDDSYAYYYERWFACYYDTLVGYDSENEYELKEDGQEVYLGRYAGNTLPPIPDHFPGNVVEWEEAIYKIKKELLGSVFNVKVNVKM